MYQTVIHDFTDLIINLLGWETTVENEIKKE